jgi:hypothetical protein
MAALVLVTMGGSLYTKKVTYLCGQTTLHLNSIPTPQKNVYWFQSPGTACKYVDDSNSLML